MALAHLLNRMQAHAPFKFELEAVTLSYGMGEDYSHLHAHCEEHGIKHSVLDSNIYEVSGDTIREIQVFVVIFRECVVELYILTLLKKVLTSLL